MFSKKIHNILGLVKIFLYLQIFVIMLIVKIDQKTPIEKALKTLKSKVIKTKQNDILRERKEFVKKSVQKRTIKKNAIFKQKIKDSH